MTWACQTSPFLPVTAKHRNELAVIFCLIVDLPLPLAFSLYPFFFFFFFLNHGAAKILEFKSGFRTGGMNHIDTLFCFRQHPEQMRCFGVDISPTWTAVRFSWSSTRYHRVELLLRNEYNWCISIIKKNHCFCRANLVHWPWFRFSKVAFVMAAKIAC